MIGGVAPVVAVLAAAAVLYGMQRTTPLYSDITAPIAVPGIQGERVDTEGFAIGVANVTLARRIAFASFGSTQTYSTSGVWIIVEAAAEAKQESVALASAQWLGRNGARYMLSQRLSMAPGFLGSERLEPGIPRPVLMIFEVPESQVSGGTLLIAQTALMPLLEEASIDMRNVDPGIIRPEMLLGRGNSQLPWTLEETR